MKMLLEDFYCNIAPTDKWCMGNTKFLEADGHWVIQRGKAVVAP
jgi:hypothetical protein